MIDASRIRAVDEDDTDETKISYRAAPVAVDQVNVGVGSLLEGTALTTGLDTGLMENREFELRLHGETSPVADRARTQAK